MSDDSLNQDLWAGKTPDNSAMVGFRWRDIRSTDHWNDDSGTIRPARHICSAGYIVYDGTDPGEPTCDIIVLANHYDYEEERWAEFTVFPKTVPRGKYGTGI
jgi:hypothetical protein